MGESVSSFIVEIWMMMMLMRILMTEPYDYDDDTDNDNDYRDDSYTAAGATAGASVPCSLSHIVIS